MTQSLNILRACMARIARLARHHNILKPTAFLKGDFTESGEFIGPASAAWPTLFRLLLCHSIHPSVLVTISNPNGALVFCGLSVGLIFIEKYTKHHCKLLYV